MARYLAKIAFLGAQAMGRALVKTMRQEIEASQEAARILKQRNSSNVELDENNMVVMSLAEARLILNVKDLGDQAEIDTNYQHLFRVNEKATGGSFYIQSKVFRAKERIDKELIKLRETSTSTST